MQRYWLLKWMVHIVTIWLLLLSRSRLCHYSVGGAWWHLCFYESF
jgi:hypothetical protein